ncbi:MAG: class I SAM-dependent methyltransferase [Goleter apudmare HA4340-LM2]|jgi:SAM-dependent methyltransferase|nr:class I SAM-dependent methyltransferase [Goleter apudmare HA4340-LM2]
MVGLASDLIEKIRQQYDSSPYPRIPVDISPKNQPNLLYIHNLATPYYLRNQKVIDTKEKLILDAGCGTGYKSLVLAEANPGAKIVGVDISDESIKLARQRLEYHGFDNAEFHVLSIENLEKLGYQFDYINCDEALYLFPDIVVALQAMKAVLKPDGIIRANLHSSIQRSHYFRAQQLFRMMGLMDNNPEELETEIVVETMKALKDNIIIKATTWTPDYEGENGKEKILVNHLLQADKGYTIPDIFGALKSTDLEFISMVNWRNWDLIDLFKEPDNLPAFLGMSLPDIFIEERLHLFELIHPVHRLLDFWCGHPKQAQDFVPVSEWSNSNWRIAKVYLFPQLKTSDFQEDLVACINDIRAFPISKYLSPTEELISIDSAAAVCLIPLLEQPQSVTSLLQHWMQFRPIDPVTLMPRDEEQAFKTLQQFLWRLENLGYVMIEL